MNKTQVKSALLDLHQYQQVITEIVVFSGKYIININNYTFSLRIADLTWTSRCQEAKGTEI